MYDYEKRSDFLLHKTAEFIALLDAHKLSFTALSDDEYEGKDMETYQHYYKLETFCYEISLFLNPENAYFNEFTDLLDETMKSAGKLRQDNSFAEMVAKGLRNPEEYAKAFNRAKNSLGDSDNLNTTEFIEEAKKMRDAHLLEYLSQVEVLSKYKKGIVDITRKYLKDEKNDITGGHHQ